MKALSRTTPWAGIVAEGDAVDGGEIRIAAGFAGPRRAELARRFGRLGDALRRRGMGRHHVGAIGGACARDRSAKGAPLAKRGEEPSRAVGVVSGAGDGLDADLVSREFLLRGKNGRWRASNAPRLRPELRAGRAIAN